jgi:hypothetical protein
MYAGITIFLRHFPLKDHIVMLPRIAIAGVLLVSRIAVAQPTGEVAQRTLMVESPHGRGTIFLVDVEQREYWITAKHILTGAKHPPWGNVTNKSESLRILNPGVQGEDWLSVNFAVIDPGKDIDIVVLAPPEILLKNPLGSPTADSNGIVLGGNCEFLGYPFGAAWRPSYTTGVKSWMPFVKHCTVSAIIFEPQRMLILDGINNVGFSGGPVIFGTSTDLKIVGVVSGYRTEPTDVIPSDPTVKPNATVNVNSGFFTAYDIFYAIDAIHKNPVGPIREAK